MNATPDMLKWQKEIYGVADEDIKILLDEYQVSERMMKESVLLIRDWYSKQAHLPQVEFEDRTLEKLLAICKFSVETVKDKIDNKMTAASLMPEFFADRDPCSSKLSKVLDYIEYAAIPKLSPEKYRFEYRIISGDEIDFEPIVFFAATMMIGEMRSLLDNAVGDVYIWDLSNLKMTNVVKLTPSLMKKMAFITERCYGSHVRGIHLLNLPPFAEFTVNTAKTILKKKIADRVFVHKSLEDLHKVLPMDMIPKDLGGDYPKTFRELAGDLVERFPDVYRGDCSTSPICNKENCKLALKSPEWRNWYMESAKIKTDESKRVGKSETMEDDLLGMKGTFRKLDID